jgi:hypothetical protein
MNDASQGFRFEPQELQDPHSALEALAHWDELDAAALELLEKHPVHGPRLTMLRAADGWLREQGSSARESRGACPSPEELYDFGRGPGYTPLSQAARTRIDRHLAQCQDCELLVESLVAPPPAPLELDFEESGPAAAIDPTRAQRETEIVARERDAVNPRAVAGADSHAGGSRRRAEGSFASNGHAAAPSAAPRAPIASRVPASSSNSDAGRPSTTRENNASRASTTDGMQPSRASLPGSIESISQAPESHELVPAGASSSRRSRRWIPLAAAASLLAAGMVWRVVVSSEHEALRFPESPLLRGSASGSLLFPRDHVLHATPALVDSWPVLGKTPTFEIQPEADAESYWIDVSRNDGTAFGTNDKLWRQTSKSPAFDAQSDLPPGHYTWEAWGVVHGLDQHLGLRDFEVVDNPELTKQLLALKDEPEPKRSLEAVRLLHASDYRTDARRIARSMPRSPERDAYLDQVPGR